MTKPLPIFLCMLCIFMNSCQPDEALFQVNSKNFGPNSVIAIYKSSSSEPIAVKNLENKPLNFQINPQSPGYARLSVQNKWSGDFWIYLDDDTYEIELDAAQSAQYPVRNCRSAEGKELIEFYKIKEPVPQAIASFAKKNPASMLTLFLIAQTGKPEENSTMYTSVFKRLDSRVRESKEGKNLYTDLLRISRQQPGAKMAGISGSDSSGKAFDPKILKGVNLFICWISYDGPSRSNNIKLVELYGKYKSQGVEFIGISYDKHEKWWKTVIKDDGLTWPQYADLLGARSPNPGNLSNYKAPYLFITDQTGIILSNDVTMEYLDFELENRLSQSTRPATTQ